MIAAVNQARQRRRLALLDWIDGESPMKGRSGEFIEGEREFRETFAIGVDDSKP